MQWGSGHAIAKFNYPTVMSSDRAMLKWLTTLEVEGATLLQGVPSIPAAAYTLCERVAKVKYTHFG